MLLKCPACSARYTIATERLEGRSRATVRCKRCGESFPVDPSEPRGEVCAPPAAAPLTGERNESSVLFSLAALAKQAPAPPAAASAQRADDIVNLGGGGAFAPLFAPPVTFVPAPDNDEIAQRSTGPIMIGAIVMAAVAIVSVATLLGVRSTSPAPAVKAVTAALGAPAEVPSVASAVAATETPAASGRPITAVTPVRTSTTSNVPPPVRSAAHTAQAPTVSTPSTPSASPAAKCCPGESEMACQMRLAAGAACGAEPARPTGTSAPPFDRPAAARALAVNVASCKRGDGPTGAGHVRVTFQPSGTAMAVDLDAPYAGTATGTCVAQRYRGASVPAFAGGPISVGKTFAIE